MTPFELFMLGAGAIVSALLFHKLRRIHLATFELADHAVNTRRETESLFAQIQALLALERILSLRQPLPPVRGWAGSPDFLLALAERVFATKPMTVVECSSGVSTVVAARCLQQLGSGHVYSLEHDEAYAEKTRALLAQHGLSEWATVLAAPLQLGSEGTPWYQDAVLPAALPPIDLLVVDGPPATTATQARYPALPRLRPRMATRFALMLDDADRPDELAIVQRWRDQFPGLKVSRPPCEKGLAVLEVAG